MNRLKSILICMLSISGIYSFAQNGNDLFKANCAVCHTIGNGILVGPDLKGVYQKYSEAHLLKWIKSSQSVIKSGDTAAKNIYKQFNNIVMPDQALADVQIKSIIGYIKTESLNQMASADTLPNANAQASANNQAMKNESSSGNTIKPEVLITSENFFNCLLVSIFISFFMVILWVLTSALRNLSDALKKQ